MPRSPTVYTLPPGTTPQQPNTTISSATFNAFADDVANTFNTPQPIAYGGTGGATVMTGWDGLAALGANVASAASINLNNATGPSISITGPTTISTVTLAEGAFRIVRANAIFTWEASANLLVNGSSTDDITASANQLFLVRGGAGGVTSVVSLGPIASSLTYATNAQALAGVLTTVPLNPANLAAALYAGTDNAGGATITMGDGGYFNLITSTTAITAFAFTTDAVGRSAKVRFNTARTLTHNGTSLILPGGANITTAQGDIAGIRSLGSGNFVVDWYTRANGQPVVAPAAGQPIPSSSTFAVGTMILASQLSGSPVANGATVSGADIRPVGVAGGTVSGNGAAQTGTWTNRHGASVATGASSAGLFVRTS